MQGSHFEMIESLKEDVMNLYNCAVVENGQLKPLVPVSELNEAHQKYNKAAASLYGIMQKSNNNEIELDDVERAVLEEAMTAVADVKRDLAQRLKNLKRNGGVQQNTSEPLSEEDQRKANAILGLIARRQESLTQRKMTFDEVDKAFKLVNDLILNFGCITKGYGTKKTRPIHRIAYTHPEKRKMWAEATRMKLIVCSIQKGRCESEEEQKKFAELIERFEAKAIEHGIDLEELTA